MTPLSQWRWFGCAGHLIVGSKCRFHLHTRVGDYRVSSVGDYWPDGAKAPETIGSDRLYETFVFRVSGPGEWGEGVIDEWSEIDSDIANDEETATRNHMAMCRKWAKS